MIRMMRAAVPAGHPPCVWVERWMVREGDRVQRKQPIAEIVVNGVVETLEAVTNGCLEWILVPDETLCAAGHGLCIITEGGDGFSSGSRCRPRRRSTIAVQNYRVWMRFLARRRARPRLKCG